MRAFWVLAGIVLLAGCGGDGKSPHERVTGVVEERGFDKDVRGTTCSEVKPFKGPSGVTGWRCALALAGGGEATCHAIHFEEQAQLERCEGVEVDPPSRAYVQAVMRDSHDGAERARCVADGPRAWDCIIVVRHGADGTGRYEALPDGSSVIEGSMSISSPASP